MADNSIVNLIQRLEDLIKTIERARGTTESFGEVTISGNIPAQLKDQISLVRKLRTEYLSLIDVILKGSKLPLLSAGQPVTPMQAFGAEWHGLSRLWHCFRSFPKGFFSNFIQTRAQ